MGRRYAVTGVASGIGAELARVLKTDGHAVLGFDLVEASDNIDSFIRLDLNDPKSIDNAVDQVDWALDGLCNNAGLPPRDGLETRILQVNFLGQRRFTERMLSKFNPGASIVNMASRAGHGWRENINQIKRLAALQSKEQLDCFVLDEGIDATRCYNLTKETMILWTVAMTERMIARDIRINSLSPGGVATGILDDFKRAFGEKMARNVARAGRPGLPEEIAKIGAFVLSPESNWLKGEDVAIDGGMAAFNMSEMLELDEMCHDGN